MPITLPVTTPLVETVIFEPGLTDQEPVTVAPPTSADELLAPAN